MSRIKILPDILSNKIAAGEVVERPASVAKELIENALDAGANRIFIEIENGGRKLIRVSDNGIGMGRDDALLSIERFATSKLFSDKDLFSIQTLGFRGEALPSIASVSKFVLETSDGETGTRIDIEGGKILRVTDIGAPRGTMVAVKNIFFNTPARRKFLKTVNTEMGHIADTVSSMALGRPDVYFRLMHNGKTVKNINIASNPVERVKAVFGATFKDAFRPVSLTLNAVSVSGWAASPAITRSTSRGIYIYVNGRFVRDRVVLNGLLKAYQKRLMKGQYPIAVISVSVPSGEVDVNVHPTKHEVKFLNPGLVHDAVFQAVSGIFTEKPPFEAKRAERKAPPSRNYERPAGRVAEQQTAFHRETENEPAQMQPPVIDAPPGMTESYIEENDAPAESMDAAFERKPAPTVRQSPQQPLWESKRFSDLNIIGQFHGVYIVCESDDSLILVDQHAAHERVLFEQLKSKKTATSTQKLLIPETFDLNHTEATILERMIPDFNRIGLEIEPFGQNTFVVKSAPVQLAGKSLIPVIMEIVEAVAKNGFSAGPEKALEEGLMVMACHGAIRANQKLTDKQIVELMKQLDACEDPSHCPHGRPTWIQWTKHALEKSFRRVV